LRGAQKAIGKAPPDARAGLAELVLELEQRVARAG